MVRTKALYDELVEQPGATEWEQLDGENERIQSSPHSISGDSHAGSSARLETPRGLDPLHHLGPFC